MLGLIQKEAGSICVLGKEQLDNEIKEQIGVVFDGNNYPEIFSTRKLNRVMKNVYHSWEEHTFLNLLKKFSLPTDKPIKQFSKGMKMKLAIAVALSHNSKLLILDEATSGLDPVIRDDILDILLDFAQDETHSILISSHITTDLEKIADYIVFIHEGQVVFSKPKDELIEQYGIIKCGAAQFEALDKSDIIVYRKMDYEQIFFAGNSISGSYVHDLVELIGDKDFSVNVISKSGTTTEPSIAFRVFKEKLVEKYGEDRKSVV